MESKQSQDLRKNNLIIRTQGDDFSTQANLTNDKVFLKDYDIEQNEHFVKYVFIPYFKDIFKDLAERSDKKAKGINHIVFIEVIYFKYQKIANCNLTTILVCEFTGNSE